jgi:hypothetical protein
MMLSVVRMLVIVTVEYHSVMAGDMRSKCLTGWTAEKPARLNKCKM